MRSPDQINLFLKLATDLKLFLESDSKEFNEIKRNAAIKNSWFDQREIDRMIQQINKNYLDKDKIIAWLKDYQLESIKGQTVGVVAAGNIPLVCFHDVWCSLACGMNIKLKLSSKDDILSPFLFQKINQLAVGMNNPIQFVDTITDNQYLITSGGNLSAAHFRNYSLRIPCLIRGHRNSIAVLNGQETEDEIMDLGQDIFSYYGLGCRNISKIFLPNKELVYSIADLFDNHFSYVMENTKYVNNYDYQLAILSLNKSRFYQSKIIHFHENSSIASPTGTLHYEVYNSLNEVDSQIKRSAHLIQCIAANNIKLNAKKCRLGMAQWPELWDYQDDIDVLEFFLTNSTNEK
jgi:hypothetical protein